MRESVVFADSVNWIGMRIGDAKEFELLLEAVAADALDAEHHRGLYRGLIGTAGSYSHEFAQAPTFWWLTVRAHADVVLYRLARLYDQTAGSLSLRSWLQVIEDNVHLFDERNFRQRLKDNPFVKSLADNPRRPDAAQLKLDQQSVTRKDPVGSALVSMRHLTPRSSS